MNEPGKRRSFLGVLLLITVLLVSCQKPDPEVQRRAAMKLTADNMRRCLPPAAPSENAELTIAAVARDPEAEATVVRMVVYAKAQPAEIDLPIYLMSRGRWTINDTGRAYLLDENCREYKLKGTQAVFGDSLPRDGKVKLPAHTAYEFRLLFSQLPDVMQMGVLVYGSRVLPFSLLVETR